MLLVALAFFLLGYFRGQYKGLDGRESVSQGLRWAGPILAFWAFMLLGSLLGVVFGR